MALAKASQNQLEKSKKRQEDKILEDKNRAKVGAPELPASKASQEQAQLQHRADINNPDSQTRTVVDITHTQEKLNAPLPEQSNVPQVADTSTPVKDVPVVGELAGAGASIAENKNQVDLIQKIKRGEASGMDLANARANFNLNPVDLAVIDAGEADVSKMGAIVETLPFVPKEAKKYLSAFGTPSKKVEEITTNVDTLSGNIDLWTQSALANPQLAGQYVGLIESAEREVARLESRIKLISIQSPAIQESPEQIIEINSKINGFNTKIDNSRRSLQLAGLR